MKVKILKGFMTKARDTNNIENQINDFIKNKKVIDIKHSMCVANEATHMYFIVVTILYEDE
ncbi:hypothetical protein ACLD43_13865 [Clostridium botulinum]|uniref:hypothetical protein n=1 Tax=Clostridium botulinum TaxID=1491 RepID=UPI003A7F9B98